MTAPAIMANRYPSNRGLARMSSVPTTFSSSPSSSSSSNRTDHSRRNELRKLACRDDREREEWRRSLVLDAGAAAAAGVGAAGGAPRSRSEGCHSDGEKAALLRRRGCTAGTVFFSAILVGIVCFS